MRTGYHHGNLRAALLDAAAELLREHGVDGVTLRGAAARAGVSHAAPYHHFADKAALVEALAISVVERFSSALEHAWATTAGPASRRFGAVGVAYVRFALEHPSEFGLMHRPELRTSGAAGPAAVTVAFGRAYGILLDGIRTCQADGAFTPGPPEPLALTAWSTVHGLAVLAMEGLLPAELTAAGGWSGLAEVVTRTLGAGLVRRTEPLEPQ